LPPPAAKESTACRARSLLPHAQSRCRYHARDARNEAAHNLHEELVEHVGKAARGEENTVDESLDARGRALESLADMLRRLLFLGGHFVQVLLAAF
jgi:hypothetical protein